jgi:hypothetical protein
LMRRTVPTATRPRSNRRHKACRPPSIMPDFSMATTRLFGVAPCGSRARRGSALSGLFVRLRCAACGRRNWYRRDRRRSAGDGTTGAGAFGLRACNRLCAVRLDRPDGVKQFAWRSVLRRRRATQLRTGC